MRTVESSDPGCQLTTGGAAHGRAAGRPYNPHTNERHPLLPAPYCTGLEHMAEPVISVRGLRKSYGELEAVRGHRPRGRSRRDLRLPRAERRGQDDDGRDPRGLPRAHRRRGHGARRRPGARADRDWRERIGIVLQESRHAPGADRAGVARALRRLLPRAARRGRDDRARRAHGEGRRPGRPAVGRPAAAPRRGARARSATRSCCSSTSRRPASTRRPGARPGRWSPSLRELGKTIFLTTHYMEEAQELADRVAIIAARRDRRRGTARASWRPRRTAARRSASACPAGIAARRAARRPGRRADGDRRQRARSCSGRRPGARC